MKTLLKKTLTSLTIASTLIASQAFSHDLNMWPSQFNVNSDKATTVTVDLTFSETPFRLDHSAPAAGVRVLNPQGEALRRIGNIYQSAQRTTFDLPITEQGTYTISYLSKPRYSTSYKVDGKKKRLRLDKVAAQSKLPKSAKGAMTKKSITTAVAFVTNTLPSKKAFTASGQGLELLPITHPSDYVTGDTITMQLFYNGKPLTGTAAKLQRSGAQYTASSKPRETETDAKGQLSYQFDQGGLYTLSVKHNIDQKGELFDAIGYRLYYSFEVTYE